MKLLADAKRHPLVTAIIVLLGSCILAYSTAEGREVQAIAYLGAVLVSALVVDFLAAKMSVGSDPILVRSPVKETLWILATYAVVIALSTLKSFVLTGDTWDPVRWGVYGMNALFVFPTVLIVLFLKWGYRPRDIGIRFRHFWIGLPVIAVFAIAAFTLAPGKIQFANNFRDLGIPQTFFISFFVAAAPEEFVRYLAQTRLGKLFGNYAAGWLTASVVWALLHLPSFYAHSTHGFASAFMGVVAIIPLGLLWSFMNHRTRSITPAVLVHGTNLWALQDL